MEQNALVQTITGSDVLILSIFVLFIGTWLAKKIPFLSRHNIPDAVTGGLIFSIFTCIVYYVWKIEIRIDMTLRNYLLLIFFSTIGLSAKVSLLKAGGKHLAVMVLIAAVFLVIQDITGILFAKAVGAPAGYGLFGGSVSLAGGYGTAIAWGDIARQEGLEHAQELGIACATFGLIAGGLFGGPLGAKLISKYRLTPKETTEVSLTNKTIETIKTVCTYDILKVVLMVSLCVELGDLVNRFLFARGVLLPGFLTAMAVGMLLTNMGDLIRRPVNQELVQRVNDLSLPLFIAMSMMSIQLWLLSGGIGFLLILMALQVVVMTFFASIIVFRLMGKDYDAAIISAGFVGLGLGATPVGIANMNSITAKYGPSPKAFLIIPLVGAFFIDITNALVIKFFLGFLQ